MRFPHSEPAVGAGANASISAVPDAAWAKLVGYSWTNGCPVGRSRLRWVRVNFCGFDGVRSRGSLVVNASIADVTAAAFTRLYELQFRIGQMKPMDSSWGHNPSGRGGEQGLQLARPGRCDRRQRLREPLRCGRRTVYPDRYRLSRRGQAPGVFSSSSSAAVRAFTSQGLRWG